MKQLLLICLLLSAAAQACDLAQVKTKMDLWRQPACLRGANLWQKLVDARDDGNAIGPGPVGPPHSSENFQRLAEWGANYVNLSHPGIYTESPPYKLNEKVAKNLDALIEAAAKANLFVVISYRTGPGRTEQALSAEPRSSDHMVWQSKAAQNAWVEMWKATARRYKNRPHVVGFDLMVEPNANGTLFKIYDPEPFFAKYEGTLYDWNPLARKIGKAVRTLDSATPILIGAMNWSSVSWLNTLPKFSFGNVVYLAHHYEPFVYTHQAAPFPRVYPGLFDANYDGKNDNVNKSFVRSLLQPLFDFKADRQAVVAVNEFGLSRWQPGAERYLKDLYEIFDEGGVSTAIWEWMSDFEGVDWDDFNFRKGGDPRNHLEVQGSRLELQIRAAWAKNRARPELVRGRW